MYRTAEGLLSQTQERPVPLWQTVLGNEVKLTEKTEQQVFNRLEKTCGVTKHSVTKVLPSPQHAVGGLITSISQIQNKYPNPDFSLCGSWMNHSMALAFSHNEINAAMGKICMAPTASACEILPVMLLSMQGKRGLTLRGALCGLLTAARLSAIITHNATMAGTEGEYQAECDVTAVIASAAAVELCHDPPEVTLHAGGFCLTNAMGLVCDPVAELVQVPYAQRNAPQTVNALLSTDWAFTNQRGVILPDQVIAAMYHIGKVLPTQLRETAQGGLAATPAVESIFENIFIKHEETKTF